MLHFQVEFAIEKCKLKIWFIRDENKGGPLY
jgi:hypothetical protein